MKFVSLTIQLKQFFFLSSTINLIELCGYFHNYKTKQNKIDEYF